MYNGKSILAIIPARGGSKGVPRKNIKLIGEKPMIAWSIEAAQNSKYIDKIIVSTEDEEIKDISLGYGAEIPFLRPNELAKDDTSGVDPILFTINKLRSGGECSFDYLILLQPTSPLRNEEQIDCAIEMLFNDSQKFDSLISVTELEHPIFWNRVIENDNKLRKYIEYDQSKCYRRQNFNKMYRLNGAIYIIEINKFMELENFETNNTLAYVMDRKSAIDIDCQDDFDLAEYYLRQHYREKEQ